MAKRCQCNPPRVHVSKTTLYLDDTLRKRLKLVATDQGKTVTELLAEGAELVLQRYQAKTDREALRRAAAEARDRLRCGVYTGPSWSEAVDAVVYGSATRSPRRRHRA